MLALALTLPMPAVAAAAEDELTFHLAARQEDPSEKVAEFQGEIDRYRLIKEPVARVTSANVQEARIRRYEIEALDEESINETYQVTLVVDEKKNDEIGKTMKDLCQTRNGVYAVWSDKLADWHPFLMCDANFELAVVFVDRKLAEDFASKLSPKKVTWATPSAAAKTQ
jgi:hypothetical protein